MKVLIKLSGKIIDNKVQLKRFINKVNKFVKNNIKVVIVHGGGVQVSKWMQKLKLVPKFVDGLRITDKKTLDVVLAVLCGLVNKNLVTEFISNKLEKVVGISCIDGKFILTDVDKKLGYVGRNVKRVNPELINLLLKNGYIVLISSVAVGIKNKRFVVTNVNADTVTYAVAEKLKINKVIFMTDTPGVYDKNRKIIKVLSIKEIDKLIKNGTITAGMIPKLNAVKNMLKCSVREVIITNDLNKQGTKIII